MTEQQRQQFELIKRILSSGGAFISLQGPLGRRDMEKLVLSGKTIEQAAHELAEKVIKGEAV